MSYRLLPILRKHQLISASQEAELQMLIRDGSSEIATILEHGYFDSQCLAERLSEIFGIPLVNPEDFEYPEVCRRLGLRSLISTYRALPLVLDSHTLTLAISDPTNHQAEDEFQFATNYQIKTVLASYTALTTAIKKLYGEHLDDEAGAAKDIISEELSGIVSKSEEAGSEPESLSNSHEPLARYIHQVLLEAVRKNASDIHFEPYENSYRIRLRLDGILHESQPPPPELSKRLASRIKVLSHLDISERRLPQDGRMKLRLNNHISVDLRVSTLPTLWGEKIVLRLLDRRTVNLDVDALGFTPEQADLYRKVLSYPQGMILITGPTGSGKTVSLYTGLQLLNLPKRNISTAEDPVEINLPGINQVQINNRIRFGFAEALRAFLRQDPDVVMIGEVRDLETAEIAVKASQTGHLVMSTLHTNSAAESISRLQNMGVKHYELASSLSLIIAQRLARKLCPTCKQQDQHSASGMGYKPNPDGCDQCNSGYSGRVGIFEVMEVTPELKQAITKGASVSELESISRKQGMLSLEQSGAMKLKQGITSHAELQRVLRLSL